MSTWVVVLEWGLADHESTGVEASAVRAMVEELSDLNPIALSQPACYAVQFRLTVDSPLDAISEALARHRHAVRRAPVGARQLMRIELVTLAQLADDWEAPFDGSDGQPILDALTVATDPVADAEAAIGAATDARQASRVLIRLIRQLGGDVVASPLSDEWTLPVDIALGAGGPGRPIAEPWSVARMRLEQELPRLLAHARAVLHLAPTTAWEPGHDGVAP